MALVDNLPDGLKLLNSNPGIRLGQWASIFKLLEELGGKQTSDAVTASTTQTQAGGTQLVLGFTNVGTVASANDTVTFPQAGPGYWMILANNGAQTMRAYPYKGDAINAAGTDTLVTIANLTTSLYVCTARNQWWGGPITNEQ